jgi:hypothetical protein
MKHHYPHGYQVEMMIMMKLMMLLLLLMMMAVVVVVVVVAIHINIIFLHYYRLYHFNLPHSLLPVFHCIIQYISY